LTKIKTLLINLLIFILLLFVIEGISRVVIDKNQKEFLFSDEKLRVRGRPFVEQDEIKGFKLIPNYKDNLYTINKYGFRGEEFPNNFNNRFKILTLGESTTFGWDVKDNETYPYYLMKELEKKYSNLYVINGGVPSYTSAQTLLYMKEILEKGKISPNLILVNIMWNDIWYSSVKNWHKNILIHQKPPKWLDFLAKNSYFVYGLIMGFKNNKKTDIFNQRAYNYYLQNIENMINLAEKYNIEIKFIEPPFDADHLDGNLSEFQITYTKPFLIKTAKKYREGLKKLLKDREIKLINHSLSLDNLHQKNLFLDALHPTPQGNSIMAKDISNFIKLKL